jgi:hypothetical protein
MVVSKKKNNNEKWFEPGKSLNWRKKDSQTVRRRNALKARKGNELATARALQALANVTQDNETARKARADAKYFYGRHKRLNKRKK